MTRKLRIVKLGGSIATRLKEIAPGLAKHADVIVNGGGRIANTTAGVFNIPQKWTDTRRKWRITDDATMQLLTLSMCQFNMDITHEMNRLGKRAVGLKGVDVLAMTKKIIVPGHDIGHTGKIISVDTSILELLIANGIMPVVASIGMSKERSSINMNADDFGAFLAVELGAEEFIQLTDEKGVLVDGKVAKELSVKQAEGLVKKFSGSGIVPKLQACIYAAKKGVKCSVARTIEDSIDGDCTWIQ